MLRDNLRDKNYFDDAIADIDDSISRYITRLREPEKLKPYGRMGGSAGLCRMTMDRLEYCYSRGDAVADSKQDIVNLLKYREMQKHYADELPKEDAHRRVEWEKLDYEAYKKTFTWLAFAVAVGAPKEYFQQLFTLVDNKGLDVLFDRIAVKLGDTDRAIADKTLYPKPYAKLLQAVDAEPAQQPALMKAFMDEWYPACIKHGFHETHEITNNFGYGGYWCFEAALIVNVFNMDDSGFRDHKYYPAALVHSN